VLTTTVPPPSRSACKSDERLVEQQHVAILRERLRDEGSLPLAAAEVVQLLGRELGDANTSERALDRLAVCTTGAAHEPEPWVPAHQHELAHGDRDTPVRAGELQDERGAAAVARRRRAVHDHVTVHRWEQAGEATQQRRLA
jgi:hypothetical protein